VFAARISPRNLKASEAQFAHDNLSPCLNVDMLLVAIPRLCERRQTFGQRFWEALASPLNGMRCVLPDAKTND
jgi:hypothetical protein